MAYISKLDLLGNCSAGVREEGSGVGKGQIIKDLCQLFSKCGSQSDSITRNLAIIPEGNGELWKDFR